MMNSYVWHEKFDDFGGDDDDENYLKFNIYGKPSEDMPWFAVRKEGRPIQ